MTRHHREQARQWAGFVPTARRDTSMSVGLHDDSYHEPARPAAPPRSDHAIVEWSSERRVARNSRAVPMKAQQRFGPPSPRIWMPAAAGAGIVVFIVVAIAVIGRAVNPPRVTGETSIAVSSQTSGDTVVSAAPAAPPVVQVAPPPPPAPRGPRFTSRPIDPSYTVASGDTLSSIAARYNTTADALRSINNLPDTRLSVGQRLIIP